MKSTESKLFLSALLVIGAARLSFAQVSSTAPVEDDTQLRITTIPARGHYVVPASEPIVVLSTAVHEGPITLSPVKNDAFKVGEQLSFVIKYEFIKAGEATMTIEAGPVIENRKTISLISSARSSSFVDAFFKVRDYNASAVDADSLVSLSFHQNLSEGGYKVTRTTKFLYGDKMFTFEKQHEGETTREAGALQYPVEDILSSFFFTRTLPLKAGRDYEITVFSDKQIYQLLVKVDAKLHTVTVPAGRFECFRIEPFILGDGIFKAKEGRMLIWLTNDAAKMPVLIRSKVFIGAFDAELTAYHRSSETP